MCKVGPANRTYQSGKPKAVNKAVQWIFVFTSAAVLSACGHLAKTPSSAPSVVANATWSDNSATVKAVIRPDWWSNFDDPYLDKLVARAIVNNNDLKVLSARSDVAKASVSTANAARLPTIDAAYGESFQKTEGRDTSHQRSYASALAWEIDIWGKLKKGVAAQEAAYQASEAEWRAGYLTLVSDVASNYFQLCQLDEQIQQQQKALQANRDIETIYRSQLNEGMLPKTRLLQQQAEIKRLETDLLELQRLRQLSENSIATLLGVAAGDLSIPSRGFSETFKYIDVPAGLPSDLLAKRPDIIAAQYGVLQTYELEGQASLARLPSVSLTSNIGNTSGELSQLLDIFTAGLTPRISIPIFDPGVNARYKVSQAQSKLAEQQYRTTVMRAFEEVEAALTNLSNHKQQRETLKLQEESLDVVANQTRARLQEGMTTQLEVFESERSLLAAKQQLLNNQRLILSDTVELYKALGGGWPKHVVFSEK